MARTKGVRVFLCGDVMTGRGVDQVLRHPSAPRLYESFVQDARQYVALAEQSGGPLPSPVGFSYVWGDALAELERAAPAARIVNLETSVTRSDDYWRGKEIHYRMSPDNVGCLTAARIDVCTLANNHVLDFARAGLVETLDRLRAAGLKTAGAGRNLAEARRPAVVDLPGAGRLLVFAFASETSGVPESWAAGEETAGVDRLRDLSQSCAMEVSGRVRALKQPGDLAIASIHWGGNWGYEVSARQVRFAHALIDGGVDVVYGHSSHHVRPVEVYERKLILYGCGDCLNDYEGISGHESFRGDLVLLFFVDLDEQGRLVALHLTPMQIRKMRLNRASPADAGWLRDTLRRISSGFGTRVELGSGGALELA